MFRITLKFLRYQQWVYLHGEDNIFKRIYLWYPQVQYNFTRQQHTKFSTKFSTAVPGYSRAAAVRPYPGTTGVRTCTAVPLGTAVLSYSCRYCSSIHTASVLVLEYLYTAAATLNFVTSTFILHYLIHLQACHCQ